MDPARYGLQQGWDNNSDLDGYSAVNDPNFRVGGSYDERRLYDERYLRDNIYPRNAFHPDIIDRDNHPPSHPTEMWPHSRRRSYEDEYPIDRESKHHEKQYFDSHHDMDPYHDPKSDNFQDFVKVRDSYRKIDNYRDNELDKHARFGVRDRNDYAYDDYDYRSCFPHPKREDSRETDYDYGQHSYDSDYERSSKRDVNWRRRESRERERDKRCLSRERDSSPYRKWDRSLSRGHVEHSRSRSPRGRSRSRSHREDSYDDGRYERIDRRRDREEKRHPENYSVVPSPTVVVKGLSHKTTEEDLYQILAEWGPLRHVRVIRERNSGISRGFSFIDFPSVGAARAMMEKLGDDGLYIDGRKLFFEYSSKPTGGSSGYLGQEGSTKSGHVNHRSMTVPSDWMCTSCGYVNFARRTSCFQCNEARSEDAPPADISLSSSAPLGKKGSEAGPTYVLVVRGLDENADEDMLRYEFSKHAPIKDLRLVRDKFTHVSRGFAFVHFHSVEDATKALDATNGITLEKNGQILRVAYAKSILGSGSGTSGFSHANSLAAAAIEAATFSQQYDAVGWAPKEYNPDEKQSMGEQEHSGVETQGQKDSYAPQSGFVWDETSGYYYDAASGFYYDGNTGLYYDSNNGIWYSYDQKSQQYIPCTDQNDNKISRSISEAGKVSDVANSSKVVISAPATTSTLEKMSSLPDAVQAAATAALAAEKKEKEKSKEIKLASKSSIIANKKKMNTVLTMWKQRSHEGQAPRVALDDNQPTASGGERLFSAGKSKTEAMNDNAVSISGVTTVSSAQSVSIESLVNPRPVSNSSGRPLMGVIRGSTRGIVKSENSGVSTSSNSTTSTVVHVETPAVTPFRTDASALGSYTPASTASKRRFSEMPLPPASTPKEQPRTSYRDRAAERRTLYGSSYSINDSSDLGFADSNGDLALRKNSVDSMPFPPGVGGGRPSGDSSLSNYEVITADKAIDETNVGNRMLRSMGWQEGLGLGKDGSGMVEPVQAQAMESRAGLGSRQKKLNAEVQAGDSYKTLIHKKALARFREMS